MILLPVLAQRLRRRSGVSSSGIPVMPGHRPGISQHRECPRSVHLAVVGLVHHLPESGGPASWFI